MEDRMMVNLRPYFSATGKVQRAPKKHPAYRHQLLLVLSFIPVTYLESGDDVALDGVPDSRLNSIKLKVSSERVKSHCASNHSSVITHG